MADQPNTRPSSEGLRTRPPAYTAIDRCLALQARGSRSWLARQVGAAPLARGARRWYDSAVAELAVAQVLEGLGPEWTVLHSIPTGHGGAHIDHLLIGPAGVFTLTTRAVAGHVWAGRTRTLVDGRRERYLQNAHREARAVHEVLTRATDSSVYVRPVLAIVGAERLTVREDPVTVTTLRVDDLVGWLQRQPALYPPNRVRELASAADAAEIWRTAGEQPETRRQLQRFSRLRAEVEESARRWTLSKLALSLTAAVAVLTVSGLVLPPLLLAS